MPHTRLDRITYTVYGANEAELVAAARRYIAAHVTDVEQWTLAIDAELIPHLPGLAGTVLAGTVTATRRTPPKDTP